MPRVCAVATCPNKGVHSFPEDESLRQQWVRATRVDTMRKKGWRLRKYSSVCDEHFLPSDYGKTQQLKLKKTAVPTIFPWNVKAYKSLKYEMEEHQNPATQQSVKTYAKIKPEITIKEEYPYIVKYYPQIDMTDPSQNIYGHNGTVKMENSVNKLLSLIPNEKVLVLPVEGSECELGLNDNIAIGLDYKFD